MAGTSLLNLKRPWRLASIGALVVALAAVVLLSSYSSVIVGGGESSPINVRGRVYDQIGAPVSGANVTVKMIKGGVTESTLWYDSTETDGLYSVTFDPAAWTVGDTVEVTAVYGIYQNTNSTVVASLVPLVVVNVTLSFSIPEFGSMPLAIVSILAIAVIVFRFDARRRSRAV